MAEGHSIPPDHPKLVVRRGWNSSERRSTSSNVQAVGADVLGVPIPSPGREISPGSTVEPRRQNSNTNRRDFQFVAATEPDGRHGSAAQRLVRSHVRKQSSRRDAGLIDPNRRDSASSVLEPEILPSEARRATLEVESESIRRSRQRRRSRQNSSPSEQSPMVDFYPAIRDMFYPLARFVNFDPDPMEASWYRVTMAEDQLLLEATQLMASLHTTLLADAEADALSHVDGLMKSVHEQLIIRIGQQQITDATIGAVMCLATTAYYLQDEAIHEMHRKGLRDMLVHRGGIRQVDPTLQLRLRSADIVRAIEQLSEPGFLRLREYPAMLDPSLHAPTDPAVDIIRSSQMSRVLQPCFEYMVLLVRQINYAITTRSSLDPDGFDQACIYIQHDLVTISPSSTYDQISRYAAMNFMKTLVRARPFMLSPSKEISLQLRACFEQLADGSGTGILILWAAVFGGMAAIKTEIYDSFINIVSRYAVDFGCYSWADLKQRLTTFLWIDSLHDPLGRSLWQAVESRIL